MLSASEAEGLNGDVFLDEIRIIADSPCKDLVDANPYGPGIAATAMQQLYGQAEGSLLPNQWFALLALRVRKLDDDEDCWELHYPPPNFTESANAPAAN